MGQGALNYQGVKSGIKLNDVIEDFKYVYKGQTIKAGDLVNYIEGLASKVEETSSDTVIDNINANSGSVIETVQLDENRVFIAHSYGSSYYLYGIVVTMDGTTITLGTDTALTNSPRMGYAIKIEKLDENRVFIAHRYDSTANGAYLHAMVVNIDGTVITAGTDTAIVNRDYAGWAISTKLLANGNIFIAHSNYSTDYYLYGIVCSISGTTITKGSDTAIASGSEQGYKIDTVLLNDDNILVVHPAGSSTRHLHGIVCTISGTTISIGTDTAIVHNNYYSGRVFSSCLLPNQNVFIAHSHSDTYSLYGIVVSINGTTITAGTNTQLSNIENSGSRITTKLLPNGNVFLAHSYKSDDANYQLYGMIVSIDGTTITKGIDTTLNDTAYTGSTISTLLLANGTILIAHSHTLSSYYLYAQVFGIDYDNNIPTKNIVISEYEQQVTPAIEPPFNAVALSSGVGAPEFIEGEVTKTDNIFGHTWTKVSDLEYVAEDGTVLTGSGIDSTNTPLSNLCDNGTGTEWIPKSDAYDQWAKLKLPNPKKITKMNVWFNLSVLRNWYIQGSNNDSEWVDLYTSTSVPSAELTEIELNNTNYYQYYKIVIARTTSSSASYTRCIEWQVSEYTDGEIGLIPNPNPEHNEQVKIARVYKELEKEVTKTGNIFPTSWNEEVAYTKYSSDDGYIIEADSTLLDSYTISKSYFPYYVCDGSTTTGYWASEEGLTHWFMITCPKPTKITKMKLYEAVNDIYVDTVYIQGAKEGEDWVNLYSFTALSQELVEITLNNTDFYSKYRIYVEYKQSAAAGLYEWQTSEYIEKVTEVIQ